MAVDVLANIDVDDLGRAVEFYCSALGLRIGRSFGNQAIELLGASSAIYLLNKKPGSAAARNTSQQRDYARHWTPVHLDFVVSDMELAVAQAEAAGASLEGRVASHEWGRIAALADPFGHGFCLIEFTDRGYDAIAD